MLTDYSPGDDGETFKLFMAGETRKVFWRFELTLVEMMGGHNC